MSSGVVLLFRVLLLLVAGGLVVAGFALAAPGQSTPHEAAAHFECPMHPEVTAKAPGQCPICKMALEREVPEPVRAADPQQSYSCPMHPEVTAKAPGSCPQCGMDLRPVPAPKPSASLPAGERPQTRPSAQAAAVIPAPSSKYAPGVLWLPETFPPAQAGKPGDGPAIAVVERRSFVDDVRAPAWLEAPDRLAALLYKDELVGLSSDEGGTFYRTLFPRIAISVRMSDEPSTPWDASTSLVRFVVDSGAETLRAGEVGWLVLRHKNRELLAFPESALLRSSEGPYVLLAGADGHGFKRQRVQIGRILKGQVTVLGGLHEGDRVVAGNAFFLDAKSLNEPASEPFAGVAP